MTIEEAKNILQKKYPKENIVAGGDYDKDYYIFAVKVAENQMGKYYAVSKKDSKVMNFIPDDILEVYECLSPMD